MTERRISARAMARGAILSETRQRRLHRGLDRVLLNPWAGPVILLGLLFVMFQAVFAWATPFADALDGAVVALSDWVTATFPQNLLRDAVTEGLLAGVGSVVVFLPQIVILFLFILLMEASGYMARAAFLMDRHDGLRRPVRAAASFRCCPALPAPFPASWRRGRSAIPRTG